MYFYELHEGDDDLFTDALLVHELEFDDNQFLDLVLEARERVLGTFTEDTLVEAVAHDLERHHGFTFVDDANLTAAVNVSVEEDGTFLADLTEEPLDDDGVGDDAFRTLLVEIDPNEMN
ncbi:MAG: hypothetical protein ACHQZR_00670 [Candidatus Limnocylindrales bacterium]